MAESYDIDPIDIDPTPPRPSSPAPLPRLWKSPPEAGDTVELPPAQGKNRTQGEHDSLPKGKRSPSKKKQEAGKLLDDGTGAVKLEETPVLDTYGARQKARWIIGGVVGAVGLFALILVVRAFRGNGAEEIREGEPPEVRVAGESPANAEHEARNILDNAKQADRLGKTQASVDLLNKLAKTYQGTAAGRDAMHAIDRHRHQKPLFGVDAPEQVSGPKPPAPGQALATRPSPPNPPGSAENLPTQPRPPDSSGGPNAATTPAAPVAPTKPLPVGFRPKPEAPLHASGWPTRIICERDGGEMVLVPAASFLMGRDDGDPDERPAHRVSLSTYYIDRHEVTVRQYLLFLKETGRPYDPAKLAPVDELPMVNVNAREAKAFCNWSGRRLPTEAQWEMAARSPDGHISFWNGELPRKDPPKGPRPMEPVMSLPSDLSPCGAFDMGANAWEWTSEYYDSQHYQQLRNPVTDPTGPKESRSKPPQVTVKGGSKAGILTWREGQRIEAQKPYLGFRGALPVEGAPAAPASIPAPNGGQNLPGGVVPF